MPISSSLKLSLGNEIKSKIENLIRLWIFGISFNIFSSHFFRNLLHCYNLTFVNRHKLSMSKYIIIFFIKLEKRPYDRKELLFSNFGIFHLFTIACVTCFTGDQNRGFQSNNIPENNRNHSFYNARMSIRPCAQNFFQPIKSIPWSILLAFHQSVWQSSSSIHMADIWRAWHNQCRPWFAVIMCRYSSKNKISHMSLYPTSTLVRNG